MLLLVANLAFGAFAATTYTILAIRWTRRENKLLATLNALVACGGIGVAAGYGWLLLNPPPPGMTIFPLLGVVLLLPAITRFIELQHEERRDAYARNLGENLKRLDADPYEGEGGDEDA